MITLNYLTSEFKLRQIQRLMIVNMTQCSMNRHKWELTLSTLVKKLVNRKKLELNRTTLIVGLIPSQRCLIKPKKMPKENLTSPSTGQRRTVKIDPLLFLKLTKTKNYNPDGKTLWKKAKKY